MKKIPGGLLLIPMLISAIVNTFVPGFFPKFGGLTEAFFTTQGTPYIVALVCFCSANLLDLRSISKVFKKQGTLLLIKIIICIVLSFVFMNIFGAQGIWGVSAIAFVVAITSLNPSLYLALVSDFGSEMDIAAFGLTVILAVPAFPIFVYSISQGGGIDWIPILSTLIPIILGVIVGNLDKELSKLFSPISGVLMIFMGWSFGSGINIIEALKAGPQGILLTALFYVTMLPIIYLIEIKALKANGISALGMSSIAGMSIAVPGIIALNKPELAPFASSAAAQMAFGVVITSIITPIITQKVTKLKGIQKNI